MSVSGRLKQARKSKGYTQSRLAESIGVSRGVIANIEYNKTQPHPLVLQALCSVLDINQSWLMTGKGKMERDDLDKSDSMMTEIFNCASLLSLNERKYILDSIKVYMNHRNDIKNG